jgi:replication factor A1
MQTSRLSLFASTSSPSRLYHAISIPLKHPRLAQQCNEFVEDNSCKVNTIVRLTAYTVNNMGGAMVGVITGLAVVEQMDTPIADNVAPPAAFASQAPKTPQPFAPYSSLATTSGSGYKGAANEQPVVKNTSNMNIVPIESMNPYSNKWTIKARITSRSEIRRWSNAKGEGHLFSVDLLDAHGGKTTAAAAATTTTAAVATAVVAAAAAAPAAAAVAVVAAAAVEAVVAVVTV